MKTLITTALLIVTTISFAQDTYLKITKSDAENNYISYPPGTEFELIDKNEDVVFSLENVIGSFTIDDEYSLHVYPSYNDKKEVYTLTSGKVELIEKPSNEKTYGQYNNNVSNFTNDLTLSRSFELSKSNDKSYNATLKFSNGIIAKYMEGKMTATLNDEPLKIKGEYLMYSNFGVIKLAYNPKTKETWWVFEAK